MGHTSLSRYSDPDWRTRHCGELAVEAVDAASGRDVWAELGGCPRDWREAAALYRRIGVRTLADAVTHVLGEPIAPRRAMRGDVVMVDGALGVCRGDWIECLDRMQPMKRAQKAWRVTSNPRPAA